MTKSQSLLTLFCLMQALPSLADPMRPLAPAQPVASEAKVRASIDPASGNAKGPQVQPMSLVAIRRTSDGTRQAWLNERWVGLGERVQGRTVTELGDHHLVLGQGAERRTLHLLPPLKPSQATVVSGINALPTTTQLAAGTASRTAP